MPVILTLLGILLIIGGGLLERWRSEKAERALTTAQGTLAQMSVSLEASDERFHEDQARITEQQRLLRVTQATMEKFQMQLTAPPPNQWSLGPMTTTLVPTKLPKPPATQ